MSGKSSTFADNFKWMNTMRAEEKSKEAAFHAPLGREGNRRDSKEKGGRG